MGKHPVLSIVDEGKDITVDRSVFIHRNDENRVIVQKAGERYEIGIDPLVSSKRNAVPPYQIEPQEGDDGFFVELRLNNVTNAVRVDGLEFVNGTKEITDSQKLEIGSTDFHIHIP